MNGHLQNEEELINENLNVAPLLFDKNVEIKNNNNNLNLNNLVETENKIDQYDNLMKMIGYENKFQIIYTIVFLIFLPILIAWFYINIILVVNVPEHWCFVPGRENTNFSIDEWKNLTLPLNSNGDKHSNCLMYNRTLESLKRSDINRSLETIKCVYGYDFDTLWYSETISTKELWICDEKMNAPNLFVAGRLSSCFGNIVMGHFSDQYGRQIVYYVGIISVLILRIIMIFSTSSFMWFTVFFAIASFAIHSILHSTIIIGLEISSEKLRNHFTMVQSLGWAIGASSIPFLFWWLKHWTPFLWITTLPLALIIISYKYMVESPRWLINKKHFSKAHVQLTKIAQSNRKPFNLNITDLTKMFDHVIEESTYGVGSLFATWSLTKTTIFNGIIWISLGLTYFTLLLLASTVDGNPFLNFALQSILEVPGYFIGTYFNDKFGRKITNSISLIMGAVLIIPILYIISDPNYQYLITVFLGLIRLCHASAYIAIGQRTMEIYPTCLRHVGFGFATTLASIAEISDPYIVYLGESFGLYLSYSIIGSAYIIGGIAALFIPETLHKKLPDSIQDTKSI